MDNQGKPHVSIPSGSDSKTIISLVGAAVGEQNGARLQAQFVKEASREKGFVRVVGIARNYANLTGLDHIEPTETPVPLDGPELSSAPIYRWEYKTLSVGTNSIDHLESSLNSLGNQGWEVVGFVQSDRTIGMNKLQVILKRPKSMR